MSFEVNFVQRIIQALEEIKDSSLSSLVARHELIKKLLDQLERHSLWLHANDGVEVSKPRHRGKHTPWFVRGWGVESLL